MRYSEDGKQPNEQLKGMSMVPLWPRERRAGNWQRRRTIANRSPHSGHPPGPAGEPAARLAQLARSFPTLQAAAGLSPWEPHPFAAWAGGPVPGHAARFILAVWNSDADWPCGKFDAVEALSVWDGPHHGAFLTWVAAPWWA